MVEITLFSEQKKTTDVKNKHEHQGERWDGMNWEIGIDIPTLVSTKQTTNENLQKRVFGLEQSPDQVTSFLRVESLLV